MQRSQLDADYFWTIHRSTIVNLQFISKVSKNEEDKLMVYLDDDTTLSVSRNHASLFKKM
uniref:LytTR family DNA-binding domain-containing protein n=1 Tax=Candidatus Thiodubiliella endoseptemdiera TaxID=2738886 RepID=UPI0034DF9804